MFGLFGYPVMTSFKSELKWDGTANYLILAGGGGGGGVIDGGGGAGGYRASWGTGTDGTSGNSGGLSSLETALTLTSGTAYSITVGQGGQGGLGWNAGANLRGHKGTTSSISGSDITTVTTVGGGGGKGFNYVSSTEKDGGSGGGGALNTTDGGAGGSGTTGQGFDGGTSGADVGSGGGGAGGAGVGSSSIASAGDGGAGLASTITGTSVSRAGGGGGGIRASSGTDNGIGVAGGGDGGVQGSALHPPKNYSATTTEVATHGRAKYGGGGGGGGYNDASATTQVGGNGGSGAVILRLPKAANYNATQLANDTYVQNNGTASYLNTQAYTDDTDFDKVTLLLDGTSVTDDLSAEDNGVNANGGVSVLNTTGPYSTQDVLSFDGVDDRMAIPGFSGGGRSFGTGDFTIELWVKCATNRSSTGNTDITSFEPFIDNGYGEYGVTDENWYKIEYDFRSATRLLRFVLSNGSGGGFIVSYDLGSTTNTDVSEWHHVAAVRSGSTATLYYDGVAVDSITHSVNMRYSKNRTLEIGRQNVSGVSRWFEGQLADIRITKGVARYTGSFTPPISAFPNRETSTGGDHVISFNVTTETAHPGDASNNDGRMYWRPFWLDRQDYSTAPVTSGLIVHLDAGVAASYPGSGSTWSDISGNGNNFTLTNSPTYSNDNAGKLQFNGVNQYASGGPNLSTSSCSTVVIQRYATNNNSARGRVTAGNGNNWLLGLWSSNTSVYYANGWVTATSSGTDTDWHIHAARENYAGDSRVFYDNNVAISGQTNTGGSQGPNGISLGRWGAGGSEYADCEVAVLLVYNRIITTTELTTIFDFYKGRFGIS